MVNFAQIAKKAKQAARLSNERLDTLPVPWVTKRLVVALVGVIAVTVSINTLGVWMGLTKAVGIIGTFNVLATVGLALAVFYPRASLRILLAQERVSRVSAWILRVFAFCAIAVINEIAPQVGVYAMALLVIAVIGYVLSRQGIGARVKAAIPGAWDDPIVDSTERGFRRWAFWAIPVLSVFLGLDEFLTTGEYIFTVRDFEQQTSTETYKVYTSYGAKSEAEAGWTFTNVTDFRYWKLDTSGLQGTLTANKGKTIRVLANGLHIPSKRVYPNIITVLGEGKSGLEYRVGPASLALFGVVWGLVGVGAEYWRRRKPRIGRDSPTAVAT